MAGTLKVDSINADSNLALKIANTAVAFIDSNGLRPTSGNVSLDSTGTTGVRSPAANTLVGYTGGVERFRVASNGDIETKGGTVYFGASNTGDIFVSPSNQTMYVEYPTSYGLIFRTQAGTEAMRINSSNQLAVGTTSATGLICADGGSSAFTSGTTNAFLNFKASSGRPCIQVQSASNGQDVAFRTAAWDGTNSKYWTLGQNISGADTNFDFCYQTVAGQQTTNSGTNYVRFTSSGQIYNTSGTYGTLSDVKLKENIIDATPKLEDLMQLKVRNFNLKSDKTKTKQLGFIAQEIQEVFPACVESFDDIDPDSKEVTGQSLYVKTAILIPMLVKAMQEQQDLITQLQADVAALKNT